MLYCQGRGIGTNKEASANDNTFGNIAVSGSCNYLFISPSSQPITLSFSQIYPCLYVAEIILFTVGLGFSILWFVL